MKPIEELQHKLQVYADLEEAREYYNIIKTNFADQRWSVYKHAERLTKEAWYGFENLDYAVAPGG